MSIWSLRDWYNPNKQKTQAGHSRRGKKRGAMEVYDVLDKMGSSELQFGKTRNIVRNKPAARL